MIVLDKLAIDSPRASLRGNIMNEIAYHLDIVARHDLYYH
jgi:hypothetical protein